MSFAAPQTDLPFSATSPESDRSSNYKEAKPLPDVLGNGNLAFTWLCKNTQPKATKTSKEHTHYHGDIAGVLNHGIGQYFSEISINGKVVTNLNYTWDGVEEYHDFTFDTDGGYTDVQTKMRLYFGTETQEPDPILNSFFLSQTHPAYRGQIYAVFQDLYMGEFTARVPDVSIHFRVTAPFVHNATTYGDAAFGNGVNPANVFHRFTTHPRAGLGLDQDEALDMDDLALKYAAFLDQGTAQYADPTRGYISPQLTKQRKAKDWMKQLLSYFDGFVVLRSGKLRLDWYPHADVEETSPAKYTTIYESDLTSKPKINFPVWEDTVSSVAVDFIDIERSSKPTSLTVHSLHNKTILGEERVDRVQRDWLWWRKQAQSYGERYIASKENPIYSGTIHVKRSRAMNPSNGNVEAERSGKSFRAGELFELNIAEYEIQIYCRITKLNPVGTSVEIDFVQERGTFPEEYIPTPDPVPDLTLPEPPDFSDWAVLNLPIPLVGSRLNAVGIFAERQSKAIISWDITFNDSDTWTSEDAYLSEQTGYSCKLSNPSTIPSEAGPTTFQVAGDSNAVDLSLLLQSLDSKQAENDEVLLFVGGEIISLESSTIVSGATYDIVGYRGRFGTTIASHSPSSEIWIIKREDLSIWTHKKFDLVYDGAGNYSAGLATKYFKILTRNVYQEGDWSDSQSLQLADQIPSTPSNFFATPYAEGIYFEWDEVFSPDVKNSYEIEIGEDAGFVTSKIYPIGGTIFPLGGLDGGDQRWGRVRTVDIQGNRSPFTSSDSAIAENVASGAAGPSAVIGYASTNNPLSWSREPNGGAWIPSSTEVIVTATFKQGASTLSTDANTTVTRDASGNLTVGGSVGSGLSRSVQGSGSASLLVEIIHDASGVRIPIVFNTVQGGIDGAAGAAGLSIAELNIYKRSASAPATPTGGEFNFGTKVLTPPAGWTSGIPAGSNPVYHSIAIASVQGTTGIDNTLTWIPPAKLVEDGSNGQAVDIVFKRSASQPTTPSDSAGVPASWYSDVDSVPAGANPIWSSVGTRADTPDNWIWQTPVKIEALDGVSPILVTVTGTGSNFHTNSSGTTPSTITLTATVQNATSPSYQWQEWNGSSWDNIGGETSSTYVINSGDFTGSKNFRCLVNASYFDTFMVSNSADGLTPETIFAEGQIGTLTSSFQTICSANIPRAGTWKLDINATAGGGSGGDVTLDLELIEGGSNFIKDLTVTDSEVFLSIDYINTIVVGAATTILLRSKLSGGSGGAGGDITIDEIL